MFRFGIFNFVICKFKGVLHRKFVINFYTNKILDNFLLSGQKTRVGKQSLARLGQLRTEEQLALPRRTSRKKLRGLYGKTIGFALQKTKFARFGQKQICSGKARLGQVRGACLTSLKSTEKKNTESNGWLCFSFSKSNSAENNPSWKWSEGLKIPLKILKFPPIWKGVHSFKLNANSAVIHLTT